MEGLQDVAAFHQLGGQLLGQPQLGQHRHGGGAMHRHLGVGQGQVGEVTRLQHGSRLIHQVGIGGIEHQLAPGIGNTAAGHSQAVVRQLGRHQAVGAQQQVEGGTVLDLGIQLAHGAVTDGDLVAGFGTKALEQGLHGGLEAGGHRHQGLGGLGLAPPQQQKKKKHALHGKSLLSLYASLHKASDCISYARTVRS